MATAYTVLGLEFVNGLSSLTSEQQSAITAFLMNGVQADGSFQDPLFRTEDILSQHDITYFQEETTTFCQQALDALNAPPPPPRHWSKGWDTAAGLIQYFESFPWENPWLDSNRVMFALSQLCHDADRHQKSELLELVDIALDWIDAHQSPETGLWQGPHKVSLTNAMAATFHFTFYYSYRQRPIQYLDRIIDSCLKLQESHGLFSGNMVGQTCLDYDALDLIAKASLITQYRSEEVQSAMSRAYHTLLELQNPDGGFANCKQQERTQMPRLNLAQRVLSKAKLYKALPQKVRLPMQGIYHVCWKYLSCDHPDSNSFSTWFRLLGMRLATQSEWFQQEHSQEFQFRRLPFLGYHDPQATLRSYNQPVELQAPITSIPKS
jgi:hypothetical protein